MADNLFTIRVVFEASTATGGGGSSSGGAGRGGSTPPTGGPSFQAVNKDFAELSAQIRSVAAGLRQITEALKGVPTGTSGGSSVSGASAATGSSRTISEAAAGLRDFNAEAAKAQAASEGLAGASRAATAQTEKETTAKQEAADTADLLAQAQRRANEQAEESAKRNREAAAAAAANAAAEEKRIKILKALAGTQPDRVEGQLNPVRLFESVFKDIANNPNLRRQATSASQTIQELFTIPPGLTAKAKKEAEELRQVLRGILEGESERISRGTSTSKSQRETATQLREVFKERTEQQVSGQRPTFDVSAATRRLGAAEFVSRVDRASRAIDSLGGKLEEGIDAEGFSRAQKGIIDALLDLEQFVRGRGRAIFTARGGAQEPFAGATAAFSRIQAERPVRPRSIELQGNARRALDTVTDAIKNVQNPARIVARIMEDIVNKGQGLGTAEENVRQLLDVMRGISETSAGSREAFLRLQETITLLRGVKFDRGAISGKAGTISRSDAVISGQSAVADLRRQVAAGGRGTKDAIDINVPTATGGIRKIRVELEALGSTLDSVRVKGRAVSDNMFDRTSVRAALQRVAVWGAAAGIVFGAVNAFRTGLQTLLSTEAAVIGLAKVMDESTQNFEKFRRTATATAVAIAQEFGQPLEDVLETLTLFGQQGLNLRDSAEAARASALAANVTVLDQPTAASAITAATRQFGVEITDAISIIDKFNEVSNNAAVTEQVLAEAIAKAGQAAVNAGVNLDQFNAIVAAISERTRQSGNEIGTALRFIFARLQTNEAESGLARFGIAIRDAQGSVRPFGDLLNDLNQAFSGLTNSQKQQIAISIAGTRRFNTFLALIENFSRFQSSLSDSINSSGSAFREQEKVAQTAEFRIRKLQNSLKALAVSFGDALLDPIKATVDVMGRFVDIVSSIPSEIKVMTAGLALGTLAFVKLSDQVVDFLGLAGSVKGAGSTIGGSLRRNFIGGIPANIQADQSPDRFVELTAGTIAARSVGDFAGLTRAVRGSGTEVKTFVESLRSQQRLLTDTRGNIVKSSAAFTKFGSVVRGFSTRELGALEGAAAGSVLGLGALNSGLSKFVGLIGLVGNQIAKLPILATLFRGFDAAAQATNKTLATTGALLGTIGRFALVGGAIFLLIEGYKALSAAAFRSGEDTEKALRPEIARRQEAIRNIEKQRKAVVSLNAARRELAAQATQSPDEFQSPDSLTRERIRRGGFRGSRGSAFLQRRRILDQQEQLTRNILTSRPELVESIDAFGNATLRSADAFDELATSAANAERVLLNLSRIKIASAFAEDLTPRTGFINRLFDTAREVPLLGRLVPSGAGRNVGNELEDARKAFDSLLSDRSVRRATETGLPLSLIDPSKSATLTERAAELSAKSLKFRRARELVKQQLTKLQPDAGELEFETIGKDLRLFFEQEATDINRTFGENIKPGEIINREFLRNRSSVKGAAAQLVGTTARETIARFREAGILEQVFDARSDIARKLKGGEIVLFDDVRGFSRQGIVKIAADGERQVKFIGNSLGQTTAISFQEAITNSSRGIRIIDPRQVREQLNFVRLELSRVATGAGRGGLLGKDLDLGAKFGSDLSAQQRASQQDETLFSDFLTRQQARTARLEQLGVAAKKVQDETGKFSTAEITNEIQKLNIELDKTATIIKFRVAIEEVVKTFEKATEDLARQDAGAAFRTQFSGVFGAQRGIARSTFDAPRTRGELSGDQLFDRSATGLLLFINSLSAGEKAVGEFLAGLAGAEQDVNRLFKDFVAAQLPGSIRDPRNLTALQRQASSLRRGGLSEAQSLQTAIASQSLDEQTRTNQILTRIADQFSKQPGLIGSALASVTTRGALNNAGTRGNFLERLNSLTGDQLRSFSAGDIKTIAGALGRAGLELPLVFERELRSRQSRTAARGFGEDLDRFVARQGTREGEQFRIGELIPEIRARNQPSSDIELARTFNTAFSKIDLNSILRGRGGEGFSDSDVRDLAQTLIKTLSEDSDSGIRAAGERIRKVFDAGGAGATDFLAVVKRAADRFSSVRVESQRTPTPSATTRDIAAERRTRVEEISRIRDSVAANQGLIKGIKEASAAVVVFGRAMGKVIKDLETALSKAVSDITIGRDLARFTTPQFGLLRGVDVPQVDLSQRRRVSALSGRELTALENPELARGLTETNTAFDALVVSLKRIREEQLKVQRERTALSAEGNIRGVRVADEALKQLGNISSLVSGQIDSAQGALKRFGESFRNVEAVNQLRVDIEKLFESFRKESQLRFDRTSIETALGRGPFAFTRPSFEQFEQGQGGRLTAFERSVATADFQERSGALTSDAADRERRRARFTRDEGVIQFAQQRETQGLQSEIKAAEQIRSRLLDFSTSGAAGSDVARTLFNQLTRELEQAGDILPSNLGQQTIRDPRTGRDVNVPSSEVLQFRGVPGLQGLRERIGQLSKQITGQQEQRRADLITRPLVAVLDKVPTKLDEIKATLEKTGGVTGADKDFVGAINKLNTVLDDIVRGTGANVKPEDIASLVRAIDTLKTLDPTVLARTLKEGIVSFGDGSTKSLEATFRGVADKIKNIDLQNAIKSLFDRATLDSSGIKGLQNLNTTANTASSKLVEFADATGKAVVSLGAIETLANRLGRLVTGGTDVQRKASGGIISGSGGPTADNIPILASSGEFVVNAAAVKKFGLGNLQSINQLGLGGRKPNLSGAGAFQTGGFVRAKPGELRASLEDRQDVIAKYARARAAFEAGNFKEGQRLFRIGKEAETSSFGPIRTRAAEIADGIEALIPVFKRTSSTRQTTTAKTGGALTAPKGKSGASFTEQLKDEAVVTAQREIAAVTVPRTVKAVNDFRSFEKELNSIVSSVQDNPALAFNETSAITNSIKDRLSPLSRPGGFFSAAKGKDFVPTVKITQDDKLLGPTRAGEQLSADQKLALKKRLGKFQRSRKLGFTLREGTLGEALPLFELDYDALVQEISSKDSGTFKFAGKDTVFDGASQVRSTPNILFNHPLLGNAITAFKSENTKNKIDFLTKSTDKAKDSRTIGSLTAASSAVEILGTTDVLADAIDRGVESNAILSKIDKLTGGRAKAFVTNQIAGSVGFVNSSANIIKGLAGLGVGLVQGTGAVLNDAIIERDPEAALKRVFSGGKKALNVAKSIPTAVTKSAFDFLSGGFESVSAIGRGDTRDASQAGLKFGSAAPDVLLTAAAGIKPLASLARGTGRVAEGLATRLAGARNVGLAESFAGRGLSRIGLTDAGAFLSQRGGTLTRGAQVLKAPTATASTAAGASAFSNFLEGVGQVGKLGDDFRGALDLRSAGRATAPAGTGVLGTARAAVERVGEVAAGAVETTRAGVRSLSDRIFKGSVSGAATLFGSTALGLPPGLGGLLTGGATALGAGLNPFRLLSRGRGALPGARDLLSRVGPGLRGLPQRFTSLGANLRQGVTGLPQRFSALGSNIRGAGSEFLGFNQVNRALGAGRALSGLTPAQRIQFLFGRGADVGRATNISSGLQRPSTLTAAGLNRQIAGLDPFQSSRLVPGAFNITGIPGSAGLGRGIGRLDPFQSFPRGSQNITNLPSVEALNSVFAKADPFQRLGSRGTPGGTRSGNGNFSASGSINTSGAVSFFGRSADEVQSLLGGTGTNRAAQLQRQAETLKRAADDLAKRNAEGLGSVNRPGSLLRRLENEERLKAAAARTELGIPRPQIGGFPSAQPSFGLPGRSGLTQPGVTPAGGSLTPSRLGLAELETLLGEQAGFFGRSRASTSASGATFKPFEIFKPSDSVLARAAADPAFKGELVTALKRDILRRKALLSPRVGTGLRGQRQFAEAVGDVDLAGLSFPRARPTGNFRRQAARDAVQARLARQGDRRGPRGGGRRGGDIAAARLEASAADTFIANAQGVLSDLRPGTLPGTGSGRLPGPTGSATQRILLQDLPVSGINPRTTAVGSRPGFLGVELEELLKRAGGDRFAAGGKISGPGGPRSDDIPILASNGEFVINARSVNKLGLPFLDQINKTGRLPQFGGGGLLDKDKLRGFQDGGLVGNASTGGGGTRIIIDTEAIATAISSAITETLQTETVSLDADEAANAIAAAVSSAFSNIQLPKLEVETTGVSVPVDVPSAGVPIDTSALSALDLGNALGSDIRNRLEAVEGRSTANQEEVISISTSQETNLAATETLTTKVNTLTTDTEVIEGNLATLRTKVDTQETTINASVDFKINERFNAVNLENDMQARLDRVVAQFTLDLTRVEGLVNKALSQAGKAMTLAMARR